MTKQHRYEVAVRWSGATSSYNSYSRNHEICATGKPAIHGSSDPAFRGDAARWNPEELLVASLSTCHQLWYLHLCADAGVVVTAYEDRAEAVMIERPDGSGQFTGAVLRPSVTIYGSKTTTKCGSSGVRAAKAKRFRISDQACSTALGVLNAPSWTA